MYLLCSWNMPLKVTDMDCTRLKQLPYNYFKQNIISVKVALVLFCLTLHSDGYNVILNNSQM